MLYIIGESNIYTYRGNQPNTDNLTINCLNIL